MLPTPPDYSGAVLGGVLPAVAASLGAPVPAPWQPATGALPAALALPPARRSVVVLVDGLGHDLLARRSGHAPFLRSLLPDAARLSAGFPTTTATSMASFGTGLPPGAHGLLGYEVLVPGEDRLFNELSWEDGPVPERWQPHETVFEAVARQGVAVTRIGPGFFDGSGLTRAAVRGGRFRAADSLDGRVAAAVTALRADSRALVYLYWGDLDKVGHVNGCTSWEWGDELESIDAALRRLAEAVPDDTSIVVTADHGMVDVPHARRVDLAHDDELAAGVRHAGGEPRALHLYTEPGAAADVHSAWSGRLGEDAWVLTREEAVAAGWFGAVDLTNLPRIGDVVAAMRTDVAVVDSRRARPALLALVGLHGSMTDAETAVPLLRLGPRRT